MSMVAEAGDLGGLEIPLSSLFDGDATIRRLAALAVRTDRGRHDQLVPVVTTGSGLPLFIVCADESSLLALRAFPEALGSDRPLYGLLPRRDGRRFDPASTVEQLAAELAPAVRSVSPHGPYLIAGHSFGGVVAYALAVELRLGGASVPFVGLLDAMSSGALRRGIWVRRARKLAKAGPVRGVRRVVHYVQKVAATNAAKPTASVAEWEVDLEGALRILRAYREPQFDGRVDLYLSDELAPTIRQPLLGWDRVGVEHIVAHDVPGDHLSMLERPNVEVLGRAIGSRIDEIDSYTD
jgi:thioesterase domain-containing protein